MTHAKKILITDTSVLINFLNIDRVDLLKSYPGVFYLTEHVIEEISKNYPEQHSILYRGISDGIFTVVSVNSEEELLLYAKLMQEPHRLGSGECSAIACAIYRGYVLAMDDFRAIKQAKQVDPTLEVIKTQDIIVRLIVEEVITVSDADSIK